MAAGDAESLAAGLKYEGNDFMKKKKYSEAISKYSEALSHTPQNYLIKSNRAAAYMANGDYDSGLQDAEAVIAAKPEWFKGYSHKATALVHLGRLREGLETAQIGLSKATEEKDRPVLINNKEKALCELFIEAIQGPWSGRVSDDLGGYKQLMKFGTRGQLMVSLMGRAIHDCVYKVKFSQKLSTDKPHFADEFDGCVFDVDFIIAGDGASNPLPVPYIAKLERGSKSGEWDNLCLCCYGSHESTGQRPTNFENAGFVKMMKGEMPVEPLCPPNASLEERLNKWCDEYLVIASQHKVQTIDDSDTPATTNQKVIENLKLQSKIYDLEECTGREAIEVAFCLMADMPLPGLTIPEGTKKKLAALKEQLFALKILDEGTLQEARDRSAPNIAEAKAMEAEINKKEAANKNKDAASSSSLLEPPMVYYIGAAATAAIAIGIGAYMAMKK